MLNFSVIIPTYNAGRHLDLLLPALSQQTAQPKQYVIVDSSSTDATRDRFLHFGANVTTIPTASFNHGGTRRLATELCDGSDHYILLTQDAVPHGKHAFERLLAPFSDPAIGMIYGRQLPRPYASPIEAFSRIYNYGPNSYTRSISDRAKYGIKTIFFSNSYSAYRASALKEVGGFPTYSFFAEDQYIAAKMLLSGWNIQYCSESEAIHSHNYTILQDLRRNFDIGVFHSANPWLIESFGAAERAGAAYFLSELATLLMSSPHLIPSAIARTAAKYVGYRLGQLHRRMPHEINRALSMQPNHWVADFSAETRNS